MPYFPTTANGPRAILANPGSVTWLLGGQTSPDDALGIMTVYGENIAAGGSMPASPSFNTGRTVNTYSVQTYLFGGGSATVTLQASMTNHDADFVNLTAVNGLYQTNLPFVRASLSAIGAGQIAVAIIF